MGWWERWRARRVAARALARLEAADERGAWRMLEECGPLAGPAAVLLGHALDARDRTSDAKRALDVARRRGEEGAGVHALLGHIAVTEERLDDAAESYRRALAQAPRDVATAYNLALVLDSLDRHAEAAATLRPFASSGDAPLLLMLVRLLLASDQAEEAAGAAEALAAELRRRMLNAMSRFEWNAVKEQHDEACRLLDDAVVRLHGNEGKIMQAVAAGTLDARASVNFQLIGEALMSRPSSWTPDPTLRSIEDSLARGEALVAAGEESRGRCLIGSARLRAGETRIARREFERARALDPMNFAATMGIAAVMARERRDPVELTSLLTDPGEIDIAAILPDLPSLTADEARFVRACVAPWRAALPELARRGAVARILPIDARLTDLPEFAVHGGARDEHARCTEALSGATVEGVAACRIESLLECEVGHGWTFAHEFAHLAHQALPAAWELRVLQHHCRAKQAGYVGSAYQLENHHEWLACTFTDYLAWSHGLPIAVELDEEGITEAAFAFFDEMASAPAFAAPVPAAMSAGATWVGEWLAAPGVEAGTTRMRLDVADDILGGEGRDAAGEFQVSGWVDAPRSRVRLIKKYASHGVRYDGVLLDGAMQGVWELGTGHCGEFRLAPQ